MDASVIAPLVALAGPVGVVLILAVSVFVAAGLAGKIDPTPEVPVEARLKQEIEHQRATVQHAEQLKEIGRQRGSISVDSTHVSFPVFGIVLAVGVVVQTWVAAVDHIDEPGQGFPIALVLRPLWTSLIAASVAGIAAGVCYRRWFRRQPPQRQREIEHRRESAELRDFEKRLQSIRNAPSQRRGQSNHYY